MTMALRRMLEAVACGALACLVTLALIDRWPFASPQAQTSPNRSDDLGAKREAVIEPIRAHIAANQEPANSIDVLAQLRAARAAFIPRGPSQSDTMADALRQALTYSTFSSLVARLDPEGRFEAAAWATACSERTLPDGALRCNDAQLRDPQYAHNLLLAAAGAGQPGAVTELAVRHPLQWTAIALPDGTMLSEHLYAMAAHGDIGALEFLKQSCFRPPGCRDAEFTRNVLTALQYQSARAALPEDYVGYLQGSDAERRRAIEQATQLRKTLPR
ncbi:hypothetical protein [Burkholderia territorii]|uniref:hypothetical protein n=1 Tax=Burkholderia territorii TaxID=1503055 RepID=UPI000AD76DDC|nr:hypothetical protein [Burkholderia territorii]